jgi:hypothetical protein
MNEHPHGRKKAQSIQIVKVNRQLLRNWLPGWGEYFHEADPFKDRSYLSTKKSSGIRNRLSDVSLS